jgi:hypothetical protein
MRHRGYVYLVVSYGHARMVAKIGKAKRPIERISMHQSKFRELGADLNDNMSVGVLGFDSYLIAGIAERVLQSYKTIKAHHIYDHAEWFVAEAAEARAILYSGLMSVSSFLRPNAVRTFRYAGYRCYNYFDVTSDVSRLEPFLTKPSTQSPPYEDQPPFVRDIMDIPEPDPYWLKLLRRQEGRMGIRSPGF